MTHEHSAQQMAREAIARDIASIAGCQVGSERTRKIVDYIVSREASPPSSDGLREAKAAWRADMTERGFVLQDWEKGWDELAAMPLSGPGFVKGWRVIADAVLAALSTNPSSDATKPIGQITVEDNGDWILKGWTTNLSKGLHWIYGHPSARVSTSSDANALIRALEEAYAKVADWPERRGDPMEVGGQGFMDLLALRNLVPDVIATLSTNASSDADAWPLRARIWHRESTAEKVLEIEGVIDETVMIVRHTQPDSISDADVPRLPTLYASGADALREALEKMEPYVRKIVRAALINDDMGRVVTGQTEAAREIERILDAALQPATGRE